MNESFATSQEEKLRKLLAEGKISPEDYEELRSNLPSPESPSIDTSADEESSDPTPWDRAFPSSMEGSEKKSGHPWQVWACSLFLFFASLLILVVRPSLQSLVVAVMNTLFGIGLLRRNKWAFILLLVFGGAALVINLGSGNIAAFLINGTFMVILITAWRHFFERNSPES